MRTRVSVLAVLALLGCSDTLCSQDWVLDAREVALGGVASGGNASRTLIEGRSVAIVLPFGLTQIFRRPTIFDPDSKDFDPIRIVEYASSPFHYVVDREMGGSSGAVFVSDVRNAILSRDLSKYGGFTPISGRLAEAVSLPMGYALPFHKADNGLLQAVFFGAGPYFSVETAGTVDTQLLDAFNAGSSASNGIFAIVDRDEAQLALALTAGYRARFPWPPGIGTRDTDDGLYVGVNYNYLRGFLYEADDLRIRLMTDDRGLLADSSNVFVQHARASHGSGFALDLGATAVVDRWTLGVAANSVLNRIDWSGLSVTTYSLASVTSGLGDFVPTTTVTGAETRVVLPVEYRGTVAYDAGDWSTTAGIGHGLAGATFHAGLERRRPRIALRAGAHYRFGGWNPTGGVGIRFNERVSLDVAAFATTANVERRRRLGIAASVRMHRDPVKTEQ